MRKEGTIHYLVRETTMRVPSLTLEEARSALSYNPETGSLTWNEARSNNVKVGQQAGTVASNGRRYLNINGEPILAHRLAWFHFTGAWPDGNISPRDGDYLNLAFSNLVEESPTELVRKGSLRDTNRSGIPGVWFDKRRQRWTAFITRDYKRVTLGRFESKADAISARQAALDAEIHGMSGDERVSVAQAVKIRCRQRNLWKRTLERYGNSTGWASLEEFIKDVGTAPKNNHTLVPIDSEQMIGPGNFYWAPPALGDFDHKTREGRIAYDRAHRAANPMVHRNRELKKRFGVDLADYQRKFVAQGGVCAICAQPETAARGGKVKWLAVDHCHDSGKIRDLLCEHCNKMIGFAREDVRVLEGAIAYLRKHKVDDGASNVVALPPKVGKGTT